MTKDNLQKKIQKLSSAYAKALPAQIENIESEQKAFLQSGNLSALPKLHRDIHNLCGSSGTYGYDDLSKAALEMEIYLKSISDIKTLTREHKEKIKTYMDKIISSPLHSSRPDWSFLEIKSFQPSENKLVYIVEDDARLVSSICENLKQAGYQTEIFPDLKSIQTVVKKNPPFALIVDTSYLDKAGIELITSIRSRQTIPIQLFCVGPTVDLLSRLKAIRAGSDAFFQKPIDIYSLVNTLNNKSKSLMEPYRILIIDDSESLGEYYSLILNDAGMDARPILKPMQLFQELDSFRPDLLLIDIYMTEYTGMELATVLRQDNLYKKIPIIFLSNEADKRKHLSAISSERGDDFLTKPIPPQQLISAVQSRAQRGGFLNYMTMDNLTGLFNHATILKNLEAEFTRAIKNNLSLSFIMVDIDNFRSINETYGYAVGDLVIKKIATLFSTRLRSQDLIGRYGGEEFAIILPGADYKESRKIGDDLRIEFSKNNFTTKNNSISVTFSAGISYSNNQENANAIVVEAEKALSIAKQKGRNQIVVFNEGLL